MAASAIGGDNKQNLTGGEAISKRIPISSTQAVYYKDLYLKY